jgi:hypothetical protein
VEVQLPLEAEFFFFGCSSGLSQLILQWEQLVGPKRLAAEEATAKIDSKRKELNPGMQGDRSGVG